MSKADHRDEADKAAKQGTADRDAVLELNFVPQWARKPPSGGQHYTSFDERDGRRERRGGGRSRSPGGARGSGGKPRDSSRRPDRPSGGHGDQRGGARRDADRRDTRPSRDARPRTYHEPQPPLPPVTVRFLPEQRQISAVAQQISSTKRAYPLMDLAGLLLNQEGACFVRIEVDADARDASLYQCSKCQYTALTVDTIRSHIVEQHLADWFVREEIETEPPSGAFVCVARCGLSGALLGPPNHHQYAENIREIHATRYSNMSLDDYKGRIEMSHEEADIEAWRQASAKRTVYKLISDGEDATAMSRLDAELHVKTNHVEACVTTTRRASIPEAIARQIQDRGLRAAIREAWQKEQRFPLQLSFALRAALRHRHLYTFKAGKGKGVNFVTAVEPAPLDPELAVSSIREALTYMTEHPGCSRAQMLEALRPGVSADSDDGRELLKPLHWLVDRGHVIEFFNGTLSVPVALRKR